MTNVIKQLFEYYEKEKGIERETLKEALAGAILAASKRSIGPARELRIDIDADKGKIKAIAKLLVVEKVQHPFDELTLAKAQRLNPNAQIGDEVEVEVTPKDFGRIAAQAAQQGLMQRLKAAEKLKILDEYRDRAGEIVSGIVRRFEKSDVYIDLGKFEGVMPAKERVSTDDYNIGDRLRAYVVAVENGKSGPEIVLSRAHPNFVRRLFESEVSEIADRTVEIRAISREAGYRSKIAVASADDKIDPVGACVGMRGNRVKNIVRELNNEKVDIIRWSPDPVDFLRDAIKPVKILSNHVDQANKVISITVNEEDLSKAIGRKGLNAKLTSKLIGWDLKIDRDESAHEVFRSRVGEAADVLATQLDISHEVADLLVSKGIVSLETLVYMEAEDVVAETGMSEEEAEVLVAKAKEKHGG